jgi:hypothetical protein
MAGRRSTERSADLLGPIRPAPAGCCRADTRNTSLAVARATPPSLRYSHPRPLYGLMVRAPGRRPDAASGLRQRDVLAHRGDSRGSHHRGIPGNSAGDRYGRPAGRGRVRWGGRACQRQGAGVVVNAMPRLRCPPRHDHDHAVRTLASDRGSTGHVWITIWRRRGRSPGPDLLAAHPVNGIWAGNPGAGAARVPPGTSPGTAPPSGVFAQSSAGLVHSRLHS